MFVLLAIKNVFLFDFVLCNKNFLNLFKKLSLDLSHTFFYSTTRTSKLFTAFFRKLFCIDSKNSQARNCCHIFMFTSAFSVNNNVFIFHSLFFLFLLWSFFFFSFLNFLLDICDIFFFEIWMIFCDFCWSQFIKYFDAKIWVFTVLAKLEGETACWDN